MWYVATYVETSMVYCSPGYLWSPGCLWVPGSGGRYQHTLKNDMVENFCFGGEGIVLEEGGPHFLNYGIPDGVW